MWVYSVANCQDYHELDNTFLKFDNLEEGE